MNGPDRGGHAARGLIRSIPLLGMLLAGGAAFALSRPFLPGPGEPIVVDARTVDQILETRADALGRELTPEERRDALQEHVDEEILLREGYRRGLNRTVGAVRARLLRRMRLELSQGLPEPSRSQLRAYFNTHAARYGRPETITFGHVFFGPDSDPPDSSELLGLLRDGADFTTLGDRFWMGPVLDGVDRSQLTVALGPAFADSVFSIPLREWRGPFPSSRGVHFVAVLDRRDPGPAPFERIEPRVRSDWTMERRNDLIERRLARMRTLYVVEFETPMAAQSWGSP